MADSWAWVSRWGQVSLLYLWSLLCIPKVFAIQVSHIENKETPNKVFLFHYFFGLSGQRYLNQKYLITFNTIDLMSQVSSLISRHLLYLSFDIAMAENKLFQENLNLLYLLSYEYSTYGQQHSYKHIGLKCQIHTKLRQDCKILQKFS